MVSFQWASSYSFKRFPQHNLLFLLLTINFNHQHHHHMSHNRGFLWGCRTAQNRANSHQCPSLCKWFSNPLGDISTQFSSICFFVFCLRSYLVGGQAKRLWLWRVYTSWRSIWGRPTGQTLVWCCPPALCYLWWHINRRC